VLPFRLYAALLMLLSLCCRLSLFAFAVTRFILSHTDAAAFLRISRHFTLHTLSPPSTTPLSLSLICLILICRYLRLRFRYLIADFAIIYAVYLLTR